MKSPRSLYKKSEIQYMYDFVCYSLNRGFNSIVINEAGQVKANTSVNVWLNNDNLKAVKNAMNTLLSLDDFNIHKNAPNYRLVMLLFYIKNAVFNRVKSLHIEEKIQSWEDRFNYTNITAFIDSLNIKEFSQWVSENQEDVIPTQKKIKEVITTNHNDIYGGTAFFSFLKQNHKAEPLEISKEVDDMLQHLKNKFKFKSITIYPGGCKDVVAVLKEREKHFDDAAKLLDLPHAAMGMNLLNIAFYLDNSLVNLSLIHPRVTGYFVSKENEFSICLKECNNETPLTIIHEYGHFISSIIYEKTANRPTNTFNDPRKWDNDKYNQRNLLGKAHSLKLDWLAKNLNLCTWEELQNKKNETPDDYGYRYLESSFVKILLSGITIPSQEFLTSEPIIHRNIFRNYQAYLEGLRLKLIAYKIVNESFVFPLSNLKKASKFFLEQSSFIYYKHDINNPYLKALLQTAFISDFVEYLCNPEEIWARSFEEMCWVGKSEVPDYRSFVDKDYEYNLVIDEMHKPQIHLNAMDRLHILYILKFVFKEFLPELDFVPEKSHCYFLFKKNNPDENTEDFKVSKALLNRSLNKISDN